MLKLWNVKAGFAQRETYPELSCALVNPLSSLPLTDDYNKFVDVLNRQCEHRNPSD